jgi:hypothetical protein
LFRDGDKTTFRVDNDRRSAKGLEKAFSGFCKATFIIPVAALSVEPEITAGFPK